MAQAPLRDYQKACIDEIERRGDGRWLVHMATGLGKTMTFSRIPRHGRVLILSHRDELVRQPARYYDCSFGVEKADERSDGEEVVSASVQTLSKGPRLERFEPGEFDTVITDECHHAAAPSYRRVIEHLRPRVHLGFTATPNRGDKVSLEGVYDDIIFTRDMLWGINNGYLCDVVAQRVSADWEPGAVPVSYGDYQLAQLSQRMNSGRCVEVVAQAYRDYAVGATLVFCVDVEHARNVAALIPGCEVVTGETPPDERAAILAAFEAGEVPCIANCMVLTEGTDLPCVETVIVARPTKNSSLYQQMVGRGLRTYPGKECLHLIDIVGATEDCGLCTAISLAGLDPSCLEVAKLDGVKLTAMRETVERAEDTPVGWYLCARHVDPFWAAYDDRDVAWCCMHDGSRMVSAGDLRLRLTAPDTLGRATLVAEGSGSLGRAVVFGPAPVQECLDEAARYLADNAGSSRSLWSRRKADRWSSGAATGKQLDYIRRLVGDGEFSRLVERASLSEDGCMTKADAAAVINNAVARKSDAMRSKPATPAQWRKLCALARDGLVPWTLYRSLKARDDVSMGDMRDIINGARNASR